MRLRALLWPTLVACATGCGRIDFDPQPEPPSIVDAAPPIDNNVPIDTPDPPIDPDKLWWDAAWSQRVRVSFDTAALEQLADFEELIDIPLAVRVEDSGLDINKVQLGGGDIRFVASDNMTALAYEIERRPSDDSGKVIGTGAVFWVRVPSIRKGDLRNYIWLYYGNPDAVDDQRPADVWKADYAAVWHLGERELERKDSTSNAHTLVGEGQAPIAQDGDLLLADSTELTPNDPKPLQHPPLADAGLTLAAFTVEAFIRPANSDADMMIASSSDGDIARSFELRRVADGEKIEFSISLDCANLVTAIHDMDPVDVARWHHIVATYDGDTLRIFHNGFLKTELPVIVSSQYPVCSAPAPFTAGGLNDKVRFFGRMDELRVSTRAHAPAWIKAQYLSARGGTATPGIIVYGAHETRP
jgi:hypothetical protein